MSMEIPNYQGAVEEAAKAPQFVQPGEHPARITDVSTKPAKTGAAMVTVTWGVGEDLEIRQFLVLNNPYGGARLIRLLDTVGVPHTNGSFNDKALLGKKAVIVVKEEPGTDGNLYSKVKYVKPLPDATGGDAENDDVPF